MQIRLPVGYDSDAICHALESVALAYDGNVRFKRFEHIGRNRQGGQNFEVTLQPIRSSGPGSVIKRSMWTKSGRRRVHASCWHVHGRFLEALPKGTVVVSAMRNRPIVIGQDDIWVDRNVGSRAFPQRASEACFCGGEW